MRHTILLSLAFLACIGGACAAPPPRPVTPGEGRAQVGDFAAEVKDEAMWRALASRPGTEHMARTEVVKVILDRSDDRIYFLESNRWPIHFFFAQRFLDKPGLKVQEQTAFNVAQYKRDDRRFVLGSLTHFLDGDRWVYNLFAGDTLPIERTAEAFRKVQAKVYFGAKLAYRPVPPEHERNIEKVRALVPVLTTDDLFGNLRYQPLELGEAFGYLRVVPKGKAFDPHALRPYDIVVLGEQPDDIPVVSGVVTDNLQAPLGHINVLCHNRKTPNMALRDASESAEVKALEGKIVRLSVAPQGYKLEAATQQQAEASWSAKRPKKGFTPERNERAVGVPVLAELHRSDVALVGAKTAQLAFTAGLLPKGATPRAFALPMYDYVRFMKENKLEEKLASLLADPGFQRDPEVRHKALDALRDDMMKGTVSADTLGRLTARIRQILPKGKVRFRSSTNAEDLPGFNGAGLYRSTRVNPEDEKDVIRGLLEVWSSTWLWAAFEEREYYRIDHKTVGMSILVQESIDDDTANGVAITANPYSQGNPGFFINAQVSGGSVTGAKGNEIPEQILYYTYDTGRGFERLSRSSLAKGQVLVDDPTVEELAKDLAAIQVGFTDDSFGASGKAVDVEFLIRKSSPKVIIVQARPYTMTWPDERLWRDGDGNPVQVP